MEIRFCDLCNESVPASDFDLGRAFLRKGKVICAACESAMGGGATAQSISAAARPRPLAASQAGNSDASLLAGLSAGGAAVAISPPDAVADAEPSRGGWQGAAALFMATGALAAAGTGMLMLTERIDAVERASQSVSGESLAAIDAVRRERTGLLQPLEGKIEAVEKRATETASGVRSETTAEVAALHARLATADARSTELRSALDATRRELEASRAEARAALAGRDQEIASLQKVIQFHGDSLVELRERIREAGALVASGQIPTQLGVVGGAGGDLVGGTNGSTGPAGVPVGARWATLLPDLKSPDEAQRLTAVLELGETGDPTVGPHIVPMLKDTDSFVRMVSVQALGDLKYKPAVPHLIECLSDDRWTVREAARDSLRTVTGKNFGFDPTGREVDMKKKIDQWRSWWRREGDNFLTST